MKCTNFFLRLKYLVWKNQAANIVWSMSATVIATWSFAVIKCSLCSIFGDACVVVFQECYYIVQVHFAAVLVIELHTVVF